ncbi:MAG TPA: gliding motility protein GldM, partial [Candidatus Avibacteroides excrementipullorum]|nr:gliding motility protein GldM [Candidatus Avibacteroides excrementipullorum]
MAGGGYESPRQKMINLMYIVLLAMLALNVSSDVLNGFSLVDESLNRSKKNSTIQNNSIYEELDYFMEKNPE